MIVFKLLFKLNTKILNENNKIFLIYEIRSITDWNINFVLVKKYNVCKYNSHIKYKENWEVKNILNYLGVSGKLKSNS